MKCSILVFLTMTLILLSNSVSAVSASLVENVSWQRNLTGSAYFNAIAVGDIDNDGDMDLIEIGCSSGSIGVCSTADTTRVYLNNGTGFEQNHTWQQNLTGVGSGSLALGDIDNDGDLDLVLAGGGTINNRIYLNNGRGFEENRTWGRETINADAGSASVLLGDIDNDGDLDLLFTGMGTPSAVVYTNNGTSFVNGSGWDRTITSESKVSSALIDLNNDSNLDLNVMGYNSAKSYINNGTSFVYDGDWNTISGDEDSIVWGDIDNDGDMDAVQIGSGGICDNDGNVLLNNGSEFVIRSWEVIGDMSCFPFGSLALGDYDNNGYLDIASVGNNNRQIYANNGSAFEENMTAEANVTADNHGSALWADVDNDMDLDLIVIQKGKVYFNNITTANTQPSAPINFNSTYNNRKMHLEWGNGTDTETGVNGLYYNLRVGTAANNNSVISSVYGGYADQDGGGTTGGYFGNMMQRKNFSLKVDRLQPNITYYWSVQTIDTGLNTSAWSNVQTFVTPTDIVQPNITLNSPADNSNFSTYNITFNVTVFDNLNLSNVSLRGNWSGGWHINVTNSSGLNNSEYLFTLNLSNLSNGIYQWQMQAEDNASNRRYSAVRTFTIDTTAPSISGETKTPITVYNKTNATLNATVTDALLGLAAVWVQVNISGIRTNYTATSSTSSYSFVLLAGNYTKNQNVTWRYYANDTAGNNQTGALQSFIVNNSVPTLTGIPYNSTNEDTAPKDRWFNLSLYSSDSDSDSLTYYIQNQSNNTLINCTITESVYVNCSTPAANQSGNSTVTVNVTDGTDWANSSFNVSVLAVNDAPWVSGINLTTDDSLNRTTANLTGNYAFNDVESVSETLNETRWYRNGTEVISLRNLTLITSGNTTKEDNWTFSAKVFDGTSWSSWRNSSNMTINNSAPLFSTIPNQSWPMNSNLTLNIASYFSDADSDSLNYTNTTAINISINITAGIATLTPLQDWNGTANITFIANDSKLINQSSNITLTIYRPITNTTEFDGATTNFTNITSFVNRSVVIERTDSGRINFTSLTLNSTAFDLDANINISSNRIEVNSTALSMFNVTAELRLYNLSLNNPRVNRNDAGCPSSICTILAWNSSNGTLIFNVTGFSIYTALDYCGNGYCESTESCSSCSTDCGSCSVTSAGGGGGGGGGITTPLTYLIGSIADGKGISKDLKKGDRIQFTLNNEEHNLTVKQVTSENASVEVNSTSVRFTLAIGESRKVNLTSADYYDLLVTLNSISSFKANITLNAIHELITSPQQAQPQANETSATPSQPSALPNQQVAEKKQQKSLFVVWIVLVVIVTSFTLFGAWILKKKRKVR